MLECDYNLDFEAGKVFDFMSKFQKQQILGIVKSLHILHEKIKDKLNVRDYETVQTVLVDCQEAAIQIGETIEQIEGTGTEAVARLEQYCETVYQISVQMQQIPAYKAYKSLEGSLIKAENDIKHMPAKLEAVFLPYKVSMWDSLESVWMAADADPNCDAYVIPIPYYDKNKDGSFGSEHYEGDRFPDYVSVTHYNDYDFKNRQPDMIFIHNPYDQYNKVTSVHPFFYSKNLKQFTDCLVYIPYYCISGRMNKAQSQCIAYYYADYIIMQAEKYRKSFDPDLPQEKLQPLGSPKFDKVMRLCNNPPEPPSEWKGKMADKRIYFYNTSITGMLANTEGFLKKMAYVFQCFADCENACLLWRPHPLLEATFDSMRAEYKPAYEKLKQYFFDSGIGIYDDTPEIETSIALSDAYIGDAGTSVTALFGVAGKPVFILNNHIDCVPGEDDWRGEIINNINFECGANDEWMVTQGNKLYRAPNHDYKYEYYCDLPNYACGVVHSMVISVKENTYVCLLNAQDILVIGDGKIERKIELEHYIEQSGTFLYVVRYNDYLFLVPKLYPAVVRYNTVNNEVTYIKEHIDIMTKTVQGEQRYGGFCVHNGCLFLASPVDNHILMINTETAETEVIIINAENYGGCYILDSDGIDLWILPYDGITVIRWNPDSGAMHEYANYPESFQCRHSAQGYECREKPFGAIVFCGDYVYLSPEYANMFIIINKRTNEIQEWKLPIEWSMTKRSAYHSLLSKKYYSYSEDENGSRQNRFFSMYDKRFYDVDLSAGEYRELEIEFNMEELKRNEPGFQRYSEQLPYACRENVFNSLPAFLEDKISGQQFDRDRAIRAYGEIAANIDGTSGTQIYQFVRDKCDV